VKHDPVHGSTVIRTVPCGVHPLHDVKVRASGARSGCPMCEMTIEDLCRSLKPRESA
jgi:Fe-S cluster biogenesis protein NfuA